MGTSTFPTRRWSRAEYERLIDAGIFKPGERVELLGGELRVAEPQNSPHATAVGLVEDALRSVFAAGWVVRVQMPVALDDESEPEPDVAVVAGERRTYRAGHPSRPALIVEVAEASLRLDRRHKGSLYARAGVADYWIVNLVERVLEVRRRPMRAPAAPYGWRYSDVRVLGPSSSVLPLAMPAASIAIADLLP